MIRLQSLAIENFRGIRTGKIEGLTDVNLLVGRNNSGKTTVLESITRLATKFGHKSDVLGRNVDDFWRKVRLMAASTDLFWFRQDKSVDIVLSATVLDGQLKDSGERKTIRIKEGNPLGVAAASDRIGISPIDQQRKSLFFAGMTLLRTQDAFDPHIEQGLWQAILANRRDKVLTSILNEIFELNAEAFQLLPNNHLMVLFDDFSLPLDSQGDGTRAALRIMMVLTMMKGTLLMLEEPECHQHPGSLERFSSALCKLAKTQEVQIIISTHSMDCVRAFLQAANKAESDAAVFHLTLANGKQDARRLDPDAVESLTSTGVDVRFLDLYA